MKPAAIRYEERLPPDHGLIATTVCLHQHHRRFQAPIAWTCPECLFKKAIVALGIIPSLARRDDCSRRTILASVSLNQGAPPAVGTHPIAVSRFVE